MKLTEPESKKIGQHTYTVTKLGAVTGRKTLLRLMKAAGPAIEKGMKEGQLAGHLALAQMLTEADLDHFCDLFAAQTSVSGGDYAEGAEPQLDKVFNEHFADNYAEMLEWLEWAVEVNFRSFFLGLAKKTFAEMLKTAMARAELEKAAKTAKSGTT